MNADAFRHFYDYHFAENRKIWDSYVTQLSHEQFTQDVGYSHGSVRDQIVHLMNVEMDGSRELRGVEFPPSATPADFPDRGSIRARWDSIEQKMREYLAELRDDMLFEKPIKEPDEDKDLIRVAGPSPCGQSRHRSSRTNTQIAQRYGNRDSFPGLHVLRLQKRIAVSSLVVTGDYPPLQIESSSGRSGSPQESPK